MIKTLDDFKQELKDETRAGELHDLKVRITSQTTYVKSDKAQLDNDQESLNKLYAEVEALLAK